MHAQVGDYVNHPDTGERGEVIRILTNPACLIRTLVITWNNGATEEWSELEFGPLDDGP